MSKASISGEGYAPVVGSRGRPAAIFVAVLVAIAAVLPLLPANGAAGAPGEEACLVSRINGSRQAEGLPALSVHGSLVSIARRHSQWMIDNLGPRAWQHNPNLPNELPSGWKTRGENVGWATDCNHMQNFFINSPPHKKNMLNPAFNYVGVGVLIDEQGELRVTEVFMQAGAAAEPEPAAKPQPQPTPAPTPTRAIAPTAPPATKVATPKPTPVQAAKSAAPPRVAVRTRAIQDILESEPQSGELEVYFEVISPASPKE